MREQGESAGVSDGGQGQRKLRHRRTQRKGETEPEWGGARRQSRDTGEDKKTQNWRRERQGMHRKGGDGDWQGGRPTKREEHGQRGKHEAKVRQRASNQTRGWERGRHVDTGGPEMDGHAQRKRRSNGEMGRDTRQERGRERRTRRHQGAESATDPGRKRHGDG